MLCDQCGILRRHDLHAAVDPSDAARGAACQKSLAEGVRYLRHFAPARWVIVTVIVASFCLAPYTIHAGHAKDILKGGPDTLGLLMASSGLGACPPRSISPTASPSRDWAFRMVAGCCATAVASIAFAYNHLLWLAIPLLVVAGSEHYHRHHVVQHPVAVDGSR